MLYRLSVLYYNFKFVPKCFRNSKIAKAFYNSVANGVDLEDDASYVAEVSFHRGSSQISIQYVLKDLPAGKRSRRQEAEQYAKPHPEYFNLRIRRDGSVEQLKDEEL